MLVSAKEMLQKAKAGHYAVGQFNINNLEWTKAILLTAEECKSPVILGVSEGAGKYMAGYKTVVGMVNGMLEELKITVPVALHLDHGSYDGCMKCIEAGFSSIMFDGSHFPIEENVEKTKELVAIVNEKGMSLEAEVGAIGAIGQDLNKSINSPGRVRDAYIRLVTVTDTIKGRLQAGGDFLRLCLSLVILVEQFLIHRFLLRVCSTSGKHKSNHKHKTQKIFFPHKSTSSNSAKISHFTGRIIA